MIGDILVSSFVKNQLTIKTIIELKDFVKRIQTSFSRSLLIVADKLTVFSANYCRQLLTAHCLHTKGKYHLKTCAHNIKLKTLQEKSILYT